MTYAPGWDPAQGKYGPAPLPSAAFLDRLCGLLQVDQPALGVPAAVAGLDTAARDATADARAALSTLNYSAAATAIGKVVLAQKAIRDAFDTGFNGTVDVHGADPMSLTLACSSRWAQVGAALQAAIVEARGF